MINRQPLDLGTRFVLRELWILTITLAFTLALGACAASAPDVPAMRLSTAYATRNIGEVKQALHSSDHATVLLAKAVLALGKGRTSRVAAIAKKCLSVPTTSHKDALTYLYCGEAAETATLQAGKMRASFLWLVRNQHYYSRHKKAIDNLPQARKTGRSLSAHYHVPSLDAARAWPTPSITIKSDWKRIPLDDGFAQVTLDGHTLRVDVDTGASIMLGLTDRAVKRYHLRNDLVPLHLAVATAPMGAINRHSFVTNVYYAKQLRFGPLSVKDVFVSVGTKRSVIGMSLLRHLSHFRISSSEITSSEPSGQAFCGRMQVTHNQIVSHAPFQFLKVPTSIGTLGFALDSGFRTAGQLAPFQVYLSPTVTSTLGKTITTEVTAGKGSSASRIRVSTFSFGIGKIHMLTVSGPWWNSADPEFDGFFIFSFLRKWAVYYNFPKHSMCIGMPVSARSRE